MAHQYNPPWPPQPGYGGPSQPPGYGGPSPPPPPPSSSPYSAPDPWGRFPPSSSAYPPTPPLGYPPYSSSASYNLQGLFPPGTDPEVIRLFQEADKDYSGFADENELQRIFSKTQPFSIRTVRLMVNMFGSKDTKKIGPAEFISLHRALKEWKGIFERFDRDRSGSIDKGEMRDALLSLGYSISPPILDCLLAKYDRTGKAKAMDYDNFVECGLVVKGLTDKFKEQDKQMRGSATLDYQTFMLMVIPFIVA